MSNPYHSVDIRDELLLLNEETAESLQSKIRTCSNQIIGEIVFLVDVARYKESTLPLNLFDTGKKISLDFFFITAEKMNYSDPGVIRVYDVACRCNETNTELDFSLKKWCTLGEVKYVRQISDVRSASSISSEHTSHMEINMNEKKFEFCTKTLDINNAIIYILNKLFELYLKSSLPVKNINISSVNEQGALNDVDSTCTLFSFSQHHVARALSGLSGGEVSKYDKHQEEQEQNLRHVVKEIQSRKPDCSLEDVEKEMVNEISSKESIILENLLEMEVNQSKEVSCLVDTIEKVGEEVTALENWIFKHNTRLGNMTHAIQTISQENHNLAQQKKNHGYLKDTLGNLIEAVTIDPEKQAVLSSLSMFLTNYFTECGKWGKTAYEQGVKVALSTIPPNNVINLIVGVASKMREVAIAQQQLLCDQSIAGMKAVQEQIPANKKQAESFFTSLIAGINNYLDNDIAVNKKNSVYEACCSVLLLSPIFTIVKQYNPVQGQQLEKKLIDTLTTVYISLLTEYISKPSQGKLEPCESGKLDSLTLCSINQSNEEIKEAKERWVKNSDDHSQYSVTVAIEKLLGFVIPASESIELVCLAFFGGDDMKKALETKKMDFYIKQIMVGTSEALKEIMTNENRSPFTIMPQVNLFTLCLQSSSLVKNSYLHSVLRMTKMEVITTWKMFAAEILASFQAFIVESRYCHILQIVRALPSFADNLIQSMESSKLIEERLNHLLSRPGPLNNQLRTIHTEINATIPDEKSNVKESDEMKNGGLGIIELLYKKTNNKIREIADKGPKYTDLILMENHYFLQKTLLPRGLTFLNGYINESKEMFQKAKEAYCDGAIRYQFAKYMDFVVTVRQTISESSIDNLRFAINKTQFVKSVTLGNVKKPLKRIFDRLKKHFCPEGCLREYCWEEVTAMFVKVRQEVEQWAKDGYEGLAVSPSSEDIQYEMNQIKRV